MKIALAYVYYRREGAGTFDYCFRFLNSYHESPTTVDHRSFIVCNNGLPNADNEAMFRTMQNCEFVQHDNTGWDIGAYQFLARSVACDVMVFFGESAYIKGPGWLEKVVDSVNKYGPAIYGTMGNQGDIGVGVFPHVRTTGFWMPPKILNDYPFPCRCQNDRYEFEHRQNCLCQWAKGRNIQSWVVSWPGIFRLAECDRIPNGFHRGDQSGLITGDRITERPYYPRY